MPELPQMQALAERLGDTLTGKVLEGIEPLGFSALKTVVPAPEWMQFQDAFGHLNGYSAIYYTYRWSKVIADDLFTRFKAEGLRNPQTSRAYREAVLDPGGTRPAAGW